MQQQSTFNFGLTKIFFLIYRTLSMRQKTKNDRNAKKMFFLVLFPSPLPRWVRLVQKTRAKNSHAWAPLTSGGALNNNFENKLSAII
jgi:hypothetical protein